MNVTCVVYVQLYNSTYLITKITFVHIDFTYEHYNYSCDIVCVGGIGRCLRDGIVDNPGEVVFLFPHRAIPEERCQWENSRSNEVTSGHSGHRKGPDQ